MIVKTDTAFAIMDSLIEETTVRVYGPRENLLAIGIVVKMRKNGFRLRFTNGWRSESGKEFTTFLYKDGCQVLPATN